MEKYVKYFEAACIDNSGSCLLESFECKDGIDYVTHIKDLSRIYASFEIIFKEWSDGTIEDGELEIHELIYD